MGVQAIITYKLFFPATVPLVGGGGGSPPPPLPFGVSLLYRCLALSPCPDASPRPFALHVGPARLQQMGRAGG